LTHQKVGQGCLAVVNVRDDGDVADFFWLGWLHGILVNLREYKKARTPDDLYTKTKRKISQCVDKVSVIYYNQCYNLTTMTDVQFEDENKELSGFTSRKILGERITPSMAKTFIKFGLAKDSKQALHLMFGISITSVILAIGIYVYYVDGYNPFAKRIPVNTTTTGVQNIFQRLHKKSANNINQ